MDIYFVRHGQTMGNVARRHQSEKTELSTLGKEQADAVAEKIYELQPTHLLSSHLVRALETARPISQVTGLNIEIIHDVEELSRPKYLHGHRHFSWRSILYYLLWFLGVENKKLAGESYARVRQRVAMVQNILKRYPDDARVVVVSHSVFMNLFLAHMCRPQPLFILSATKFFFSIIKIPNTKVIRVVYSPEVKGVCQWQQVVDPVFPKE